MATIKGSRTQRKAPKSKKGKRADPVKDLDCKDLEQVAGGNRPPNPDEGDGGPPPPPGP